MAKSSAARSALIWPPGTFFSIRAIRSETIVAPLSKSAKIPELCLATS